ncbi:hypothetical protein [Nocardia xishanensis]|uniref:hypothetical protein n=1 Tax=Nocardia xishanensis TaxID=238964 RepID=UPI00083618FB|nr:hypothetical protein [Nocardia xishanensis]
MTDDEIDDRVDAWHNGAGGGMPLHEYLGMTWSEYAEWVEAPGRAGEPDTAQAVQEELARAMAQPIDVDAILGSLGPEYNDPGDDPWGGANLFDLTEVNGGE